MPPPLRTTTCATEGSASTVPLTFAARVLESTTLVGNACPFSITADFASKFVPVTVNVALGVPAAMTFGLTWLMLGLTSETMVNPAPQPQHDIPMPTPKASAFQIAFTR
jgi:hypothetical protein